MRARMRALREDAELAEAIALRGRRTILERHTCGHRAAELLAIHSELTAPASRSATAQQERVS
jgi:hypothetical protein